MPVADGIPPRRAGVFGLRWEPQVKKATWVRAAPAKLRRSPPAEGRGPGCLCSSASSDLGCSTIHEGRRSLFRLAQRARDTLLGLTLLTALTTLAGCAPGSGQAATSPGSAAPSEVNTDISGMGDVTLTVWDQEVRGGQNEQIEQLNAAFRARYPNVTIDRVSQSFDDLATTLRLALTGDDAPDVVQANNARNTMGALVAAGQLIPLDAYAEAYGWKDRFSSSVLKFSTYSADAKVFGEGNLYGLPQMGEVVGVFYSKSKLSGLGLAVPKDWTEFDTALAKAKDAGETPLLLGNLDKWPAIHVFGPLQGATVGADRIAALALG
ncbi:MAG: extracellular solute-binding protein, partial [Propionibacteriaceae bacterium]|nr:extracellular solute-binding protein [Propionibacteriaceae bacterium]